ncbi:MAG: alpha/beta hydrolase [Arenicella sp.]|nr:alpha/beta hydrolase [Arenicella sp.]
MNREAGLDQHFMLAGESAQYWLRVKQEIALLNRFIKIFAGIVLLLIVAFLLLRVGDTDLLQAQQKYGGQNALYLDDGYGGKIHYRDQGKRDGLPLLMVHGANSSLHTWEQLVTLLAPEYRLISYDQHGHGLTGPHAADVYHATAKIETALRVLDAVGVEKAVWVGNSMGGWLTWRAALAVPERIAGVVLMNASGVVGGEPVSLYLGARLANSSLGQLLLPHITPRSLIKRSIEDNYVDDDKVNEALVTRYWELLRYPGNRRAAVSRYRTDREPEYWQQVGQISQPTLLLWGQHDQVTPPSFGRAFNAAIADSQLIIYDDAGHLPMEEIPQRVAADLSRWLQRQNWPNM